jgi:AraC-like DNA-binding protein
VSEHQFSQVLIGLSRVGRDEFWGLGSVPVPLGTFRTFCRLVSGCRTLGEALTVGGRFYQLMIHDFSLRVLSHGDETSVWLKLKSEHLDGARKKEMQAVALFIVYQLLCWLADRRLPLETVHFSFKEGPMSAEPLRAYQTSNVSFGDAYTGFKIRRHLLALPVLADERRLRRFLSEEARSMLLRYHDQHRVDDKVKSILRRNLGRHVELEEVASQLGITAVTLRRRLAEECGLTFSDLRDAVRRKAALEMVGDPATKLDSISAELGFAEYSTFHRAFRRWTGFSPTEYREKSPIGG